MTILVDMDDVLEQLVPGWIRYVNERYGTNAVPQDVKNWDMSLAFPTLTKEQVYAAVSDDRLWSYVTPMPGAADALQRLKEAGHEIFIVTASHYKTLPVKMETVLFRYYPFLDWDHVIITSKKQLIRGDVLVDDGPHNLCGGSYHKILFDAYHNRTFDAASIGATRVHNWQEAEAEINRLSKITEAIQ